jgi:type IV pilus assembly protein PilY1
MNANKRTTPSAMGLKTDLGSSLARRLKDSKLRWLLWSGIPLVAAVSFLAISQVTAPSIPAVALSADPLYAASAGDKPAMALALSVEFPTVGAQYVDVPNTQTDSSYTNYNSALPDGYLGYYDAESCYTYNKTPTETPISPQTTDDFKRFDRIGSAIALSVPDPLMPTRTSRMCTDAFSGNFLNWASSSAIDMLRLALTGGDRYVDTASLTILQRAVLPDGDPIHFWNSNNFPAKRLPRSGGSSGTAYFGAVPTSMSSDAGTNDIWVANTLNRIYFGTGNVGTTSSSASSYTLGGTTTTASTGPVVNPYATRETAKDAFNGTECANENNACNFTGIKEVLYGDNDKGWITFPASGGLNCNNNMTGSFVDPAPGKGKKCYIRTYTGTWTPGGTGLNTDGFFYSRVQVCNVNALGVLQDQRDYSLCKKYPNGNYKPSGAIQKYSDQLRLAAFGYLMDQTASYNTGGRYGGVLRAPIKYVGGKTFDINGVDNTPTTGNAKKEWNETNGVFIVNPEGDTTYGKSGVITYLNQFGRTGPVPGRYKKYDPIGELHYEALRYLQGKAPSADAIGDITADMYDGFPVSTTWSDPYGDGRSTTDDYACLKSNIVVIGDVNTHDGNRFPTASAANNVPDLNAWRSVVQSFEKNTAVTYLDGAGASRTAGNPNGANNSVPSSADRSQIMGSAYWAHTHDIRGTGWTAEPTKQRPGLRVKTFTFDVNEYAAQNNDTTRRNANQLFMASKYGGFETERSPGNLLSFNTQGSPFKRDDGTADKFVWEDANTSTTRVGEANTYFLQQKARDVLNAFDDIFSRASSAGRSIAGGAIQSKSLTQVGTTIYQGTFDTSDWSGDLLAVPVNVSASNVVTISDTNTWTAAAKLNAQSAPATNRKIFIGNAGATASPAAAPFTWATPLGSAGIEQSVRDALDKPTPASANDGLAQDRLNYLRGDKSKESNPFRKRKSLLGDIINSGVAYSGAPTTSITSSTYSAFQTANATRTPAVFVGANDGMLHAFDATNGTSGGNELFAYIPSWMAPKLAALTNPTYVNNHQSYVDAAPLAAEAEVVKPDNSLEWRTVLVGGTGGGGKGVFALDVTNPSAFDAGKVMWEFTQADDADMGNVVGRPQILKMRTSATGVTATYKWFALVGSGVNNYVADSAGVFSTTGNPALFLLDLSKPVGTAWSLNTNYYKISLPYNPLSATKATGLINFKATLGTSREVSQIFMGDLLGNMWKLDFSLLGKDDWTMTKLSPFKKGATAPFIPYPLYTAKDAAGNVQPIVMAPSIGFGPTPDTSYVVFGTGKYLEASDKSSTTRQSVYMVYDNGSASGDTLNGGATRESAISGRKRLSPGTAVAATGVVSVPAFTLGRAAVDDDATQRSGWFFDFPTTGERQISNATLVGNKAIFGSLIPATSGAAASCSVAEGGGNQYEVTIANGKGTSVKSTVGIQGEPLVGEITGATTYTVSDSTGRRVKTITSQVIQQGSAGLGTGGTSSNSVMAGRLSWRQIHNYQDLKNAP